MHKLNRIKATVIRKNMTDSERQRRRQENVEHGGWYNAMRWRREQRDKPRQNAEQH